MSDSSREEALEALRQPIPGFEALTPGEDDPQSLVELINRVLDRGVVITGDITLSVAGVDLVYLGINAVLTSISTAQRTLGRSVGADPIDRS